jgi:SulP family sulfate permease
MESARRTEQPSRTDGVLSPIGPFGLPARRAKLTGPLAMYYSRAPASTPVKASRLFKIIPALGSLRGYGWLSLRADVLAGLTVAAVAVPQAMAYALIADLPAEIGLYTAIVMTFMGALLDSSKQLINGPTNAISIAAVSVLAPITTPETLVSATILLTFVVGSIQLLITALRLGDLSRYISHSVILGFTTGASALLVLDQAKNLLGVPGAGGGHDAFLVRFYETWRNADGVHGATTIVGIGTIAVVLGLRLLKARLGMKLFPELLVVVIGAAAVVGTQSLDAEGVKVVGSIPQKLPSFQLPDFNLDLVRKMSGGAIALALLGLLEAVSMAKAIAAHTRQRLDINQQLLSEGVANFTGSFFQCMPGSGSLTRSAINHQAGAASQWSGVISAIAVATTVLLFAPLARYIPRSALAGILIVAAFKMVEWRALAYHLRASRFDAAVVVVTAMSAVVISVEFCVLIGVLSSFLMAVPRVGHTRLTEFVATNAGYVNERLADDKPCQQILIFGLEGEMFFAAAASLEAQLARIEDRLDGTTRVVILRLKRARNADAVGLNLLEQFLVDLKERGVTVLLCGVRQDMLKILTRAGMVGRLGEKNLFVEQPVRQTSTHQALLYAYSLIDRRCVHCPVHDDPDDEQPSPGEVHLPMLPS